MRSITHRSVASIFAAIVALSVSSTFVFAGGNSATWEATPGSGDWNTAGNWNPAVVPNGNFDSAFFDTSTITNLTISANTAVQQAQFNMGASAFTLTATSSLTFTFNGTGIINSSGVVQNFVTNVNAGSFFGTFVFQNGATTSSLTEFTNRGATQNGASGGSTQFFDSSNAGLAVFIDYTNKGGAVAGANGGNTRFFDMSSAGNAGFINEGGVVDGASGGTTSFENDSDAGAGTFTNQSGAFSSGSGGGRLFFSDDTSAMDATIFNNGATTGDGGRTSFVGSSTAGAATITNGGASGASGFNGDTTFAEDSDAGTASITNDAGTVATAFGGETTFTDDASAANSTIVNEGATVADAKGGDTVFTSGATAGSATITNNGGTNGGRGGEAAFTSQATAGSASITNNASDGTAGSFAGTTDFSTSADAGTATIHNLGASVTDGQGGLTIFEQNASAANSTITNDGASATGTAAGGRIFFEAGPATAGNSTIINNGGAAAGAGGGNIFFQDSSLGGSANITSFGGAVGGAGGAIVTFQDQSSAETATLTANGGATAGALGSVVQFLNGADADAAILIANAGTGSASGLILFDDDSTGGTSQVRLFGGALNIGLHNTPGVTIGSLLGDSNASVLLGANNLTVGSNNLSTQYDGTIQDSGSLTKIGTGTLILNNDNTYSGGTTISAGAIAVGSINALGTGNVTVDGGTLETFNGPRAIGVAGNYLQTSAGTLRLQIGGTDSGSESDFLTVTGTATLDGTLALVRINNFNPANGDRVNIIGGPGGFTGEFANVTSTFNGVLQPVVFYDDPLDVYIVFEISSFVLPGLTPNQTSVAKVLNEIINDSRAADLVDFLAMEPLGSLPHDYDLIAPEELAGIYELGFSLANVQALNLQRRMDDIRGGSNGFSANGYSMRDSKGYTKGADGNVQLEQGSALTPGCNNRWGVFVTGTGQFVNVGDDDFNAPGYDITTGGVTVGLDYRVTQNFAIGLAGTYAHSDVDLSGDGHIDADGGKLALFATFFTREFYFEAAATGGLTNYDTRRSALLGDADGSTDGAEFHGLVAAGYDWTIGCFTFGPTASFQYSYIDFNSFTESGSLAPLHYSDQNQDAERSAVGMRALCNFKAGGATIRPELRAAWKHEYGDKTYQIDSQFASGAGDGFSVWGPTIGRDSVLITGGIGIQWSNCISTYVYYDGDLGRSNYNSHGVSGGISFGF